VDKKYSSSYRSFLIISLSFSSGVIIGGKLFKRPPLIIEKDLLINATEITVANSNNNDSNM